ncbi:MAG TPA: hypothetical protein VJT09_06295 [Pyrinomonadaceae bacterium]|nr:hypothetical protein [Pyrinomonadaceae bacterium]
MKKIFIIISILTLSAVAVSAQTASKGEAAHRRQDAVGDKRVSVIKKDGRRTPGVLRVGPSTTYLKNGLKMEEVVRFLGRPASISERRDGDLLLATYTFARGQGRVIVAEFENGLLVSSHLDPEGVKNL